MRYFLMDANVLVALYSAEETKVRRRAAELVMLAAERRAFLYVPDVAIVEILRAFARKCFAEGAAGHTAASARAAYSKMRDAFLGDLGSRQLLYRYELSSRHVDSAEELCEAAVSRRYRSGSTPNALDLVILAMSRELEHIHGRDDFALVTAERPLYDLCAEAGSRLPRAIHIGERDFPR